MSGGRVGLVAALLAAATAAAGPTPGGGGLPAFRSAGAPAAGSPGDSLFGDAPAADRLRPPRVPAPRGAGGPFSPAEAGGLLALLAGGGLLLAARLREGAPQVRGGGADGGESLRRQVRRLEGRLEEAGGSELCRELTALLRAHVERERDGGLPPGRPLRRALPPGDPLAEELDRWEAVRFGGAPMDAEARRRALRAVRRRVLSERRNP